jgi:hypothetical protein
MDAHHGGTRRAVSLYPSGVNSTPWGDSQGLPHGCRPLWARAQNLSDCLVVWLISSMLRKLIWCMIPWFHILTFQIPMGPWPWIPEIQIPSFPDSQSHTLLACRTLSATTRAGSQNSDLHNQIQIEICSLEIQIQIQSFRFRCSCSELSSQSRAGSDSHLSDSTLSDATLSHSAGLLKLTLCDSKMCVCVHACENLCYLVSCYFVSNIWFLSLRVTSKAATSQLDWIRRNKRASDNLKLSESESLLIWESQRARIWESQNLRIWKCEKLKLKIWEKENLRNWESENLKLKIW